MALMGSDGLATGLWPPTTAACSCALPQNPTARAGGATLAAPNTALAFEVLTPGGMPRVVGAPRCHLRAVA